MHKISEIYQKVLILDLALKQIKEEKQAVLKACNIEKQNAFEKNFAVDIKDSIAKNFDEKQQTMGSNLRSHSFCGLIDQNKI